MMRAGNATFVPGGGDHDGVLTLDGFDDETIAFTDRPGRDAFPIATADFVAAAFAPVDGPEDNSFYADPPNAAFSCPLGSGEVASAVYVLRAPSESGSGVAFEVQVLYASVPGAIECGGPVVRPRGNETLTLVASGLSPPSGLTRSLPLAPHWRTTNDAAVPDARRGLESGRLRRHPR